MSKIQYEQNGGNEAQNFQNNAETINYIVNNGPSIDDMKSVALDVYRAEEAKKYPVETWEIARKRVEDFVTGLLEQVFSEKPEYIINFIKPSVRQALLNAEKGYASDETETSKNNYIEIMKARLCADDRSLIQVASDEAIKIVEKLTQKQKNYLTFVFVQYSYPENINSKENIVDYCNKLCELFDDSFTNQDMLVHLDAIGACSPLGGARNMKEIAKIFLDIIPGMFNKGSTIDEVKEYFGDNDFERVKPILIRNAWNRDLYQINSIDINTLHEVINENKLNSIEHKIICFFNDKRMSGDEVNNQLIKINPKMKSIIQTYSNKEICSRRITPQGMIIAISNYNQMFNKNIQFSDVIREP